MKKIIFLLLLIVGVSTVSSCSKAEEDSDVLLVSIEPLKGMLSNIVGDKYEVYSVIPSTASPESYNPTIQDMQQMSNASLFFGVGVPAEESNIVTKLSDNTTVVSLQNSIESLYLPNGGRDPHIWLSIDRVKIIVNEMYEELIKIDADNKDTYKDNLDKYLVDLDETKTKIIDIFSGATKKSFITYHPSLNYFASDFGLDAYAIEKNGQEPSPKELAETVDEAKEIGFKTVFYQSSVNSSEVYTVATEIGAKTVEYDPLSSDYLNNLIVIANKIRASLDE